MLEVQGGETERWRGDKRCGYGGALKTAPSVRTARAASWVSSPSSVQWPLSCVFCLLPLKEKFSFSVQMVVNGTCDILYKTSAFLYISCTVCDEMLPCASAVFHSVECS